MQANFPTTPVQLDSSTAIKLTMGSQMFKERSLMARNDAWHRIKIIRGARYDKELLLRSILLAVEPADLIPVRYQTSGEDVYFMARNCGPALEMLCRSNLIINIANGDPIVIVVTLAFASIHDLKINIQPILLSALRRRFDATTKSLWLEDFHRDEEVAKNVYCPLSQNKTLGHVLKLAKTVLPPFEYLNLQRNELLSLAAFENSNLTSLRGLDLRYNYMMGMDALASIKSLNITELWLDGNPLCENYSSSEQYIESAKRYCPNLTKLDGVHLDSPKLLFTYKKYIKNPNTKKLINQFLTHFFALYDNKDRMVLRGLYHRNAVYSLTLGILPGTPNRSKLGPFMAENRNILNASDFAKGHQLLYQGPEEILGALKRLPQSSHDRSSFRCDVMYEDHECVIVTVEGVFRIMDTTARLLSFNRTFVLVAGDDDEYNILNDQYHVDTVVSTQPLTKFFDDKPTETTIQPTYFSSREKERLVFMLEDVTTMNVDWCRKFLENTNWNARLAIQHFMDGYKTSTIPIEAFSR